MNSDTFIDIACLIPDILIDIRYAGANNGFRVRLYGSRRCLLRYGTALKLKEAQAILSDCGLRLKVWDAYRPMAAQRRMWERLPDTDFVADPATGSNHNRGAAVDVTLADMAGGELKMPTGFDDFSAQAFTDCPDVSEEARKNRALLHSAMIRAGFRPIPTEWWHFDDAEAGAYGLADIPL